MPILQKVHDRVAPLRYEVVEDEEYVHINIVGGTYTRQGETSVASRIEDMPELLDTSTILDSDQIGQLSQDLLPRCMGCPWSLVYSTDQHGFSLKTAYRTLMPLDCPVLLVVQDTAGHVFGAVLSAPIRLSRHFYGTGESFLWTFCPDYKKFPWTGSNDYFMKGSLESVSIGGGGDACCGIWLDHQLYRGRTMSCVTYSNDPLTDREDFHIQAVEVWAFE